MQESKIERDTRMAALFAAFLSPQSRQKLEELLGLEANKDSRDRAYLDDMRRG